MFAASASVPWAVKQILAQNDIYMQALAIGIANYTALAERIKPDVEKLVGSKVNLNTIVVAIKRFADALEDRQATKPYTATKPKMSLTGSVIDVDFEKEHSDSLSEFLNEFFGQDVRYNLISSDDRFTLLTEDIEEIRNIITSTSEKFAGKIREDLSKITISLSSDDQDFYQLPSIVFGILYNHQILIHSAFFTSDEMVLILDTKDAARAYDLIRMRIG